MEIQALQEEFGSGKYLRWLRYRRFQFQAFSRWQPVGINSKLRMFERMPPFVLAAFTSETVRASGILPLEVMRVVYDSTKVRWPWPVADTATELLLAFSLDAIRHRILAATMYGAFVPQVKCVDGWLKKTSIFDALLSMRFHLGVYSPYISSESKGTHLRHQWRDLELSNSVF